MSVEDLDSFDGVEQAREARENDLRGAFEWLGSDYEGRAFLWHLMEICGVDKSSFVGENPLTMARNEGRREIGLYVKNNVFTPRPQIYIMAQREAEERTQRYAALIQRLEDSEED